ncbi:D-(-)-3-hydroxybutyrate oligomer hydrolase [Caulobacter sp. RL271]|jgi:hydroxybutyrate-dimer hydrolase|uniref:D-(-)-3-hydroxybutyrate oligomer hydrolase n=1 Tax=Caulobacter segnis TaxID=88688 RepID=A0ABY5A0G0_9CAUL|nr:D-(-)-3-hydroxybutyrate oligomer hydrolase [Caulobacter segnis]USQ98245.1 D-(-)-3-hydroxybutyrate oligomer hydrolase [Caulobacter segnis]
MTLRKALCLGAALASTLAAPAVAAQAPKGVTVLRHLSFDGVTDDLVGLAAKPAAYADPLHPNAAELRRATMAVRPDPASGWGRLFGPTIDAATGQPYPDGGRVAGEEYLAYTHGPGGGKSAVLLQVPAKLSRVQRCILAVPQAGSFGIYHDISTTGFWGLQRGCAVVYSDKGHGTGAHDLSSDTVTLIDGTTAKASEAGALSHFTAPLSAKARAAFLARWPHRIAFKAAHSRLNPESQWGEDVLRAIRYAFWQLNDRDGGGWTSDNTIVIVAGNSNGGGATLYAGEKDHEGLIDGLVAGEPQVQVRGDPEIRVLRGDKARANGARTLLDYFTFANLYEPCAVLAMTDAPWADRVTHAADRCASLKQTGLLDAGDLTGQARESQDKLLAYGFDPETEVLNAAGYLIGPDATAAKYASDHGRFGVERRICGYSYASVDAEGRPRVVPPAEFAEIFAKASGGAPTGSIDLINDNDPRGPRRNDLSISPSTGRTDYNLDGARCLRELAIGHSSDARRVQAGIAEFLADGNLHGKPAIIVHGRADNRVPPAFSSRPYLAANSLKEGAASRLRYMEVENAEHFGFAMPGFDTRFVPLAYYNLRALDLVWETLTTGAPLPGNQIIRTRPRGGTPGKAPALTPDNIPPIAIVPRAADRIRVQLGVVALPD